MGLVQILRTPIPKIVLKFFWLAMALPVAFGLFLPGEQLLIWHLSSSAKIWRCQNFEVSASGRWMADSDRNCTMGLHLWKQPIALLRAEEQGNVYFEDGSKVTESTFFTRWENASRRVSKNSPGFAIEYTTQYEKDLGKCAIARGSSPYSSDISMSCLNMRDQLVTEYNGAERLADELGGMVKPVLQP